jgi:hypothetical protein
LAAVAALFVGTISANADSAKITAHSAGVVPGALICPYAETGQAVFQMYVAAYEDHSADFFTRGQSRLARGAPAEYPNPHDYGCELIPAGQPMSLVSDNGIPVVRAKLKNDKWVTGVTFPSMIGN